MDNGCPKCEKLAENELCLYCQRDVAKWAIEAEKKELEIINKKIKEKEDD